VAPTLAGVIAYNPVTDLTAVITSNTSNTLTLGSGMGVAFSVGQEIWLGPIAWEYRTKWWTGPGQSFKKMPCYLVIQMYPGSQTGTMRVYIYQDMSTIPIVPSAFSTDNLPDGVTYVPGASYLQVDLAGGVSEDGFLQVPMPADYKRALQARLTSVRPDGVLRVARVEFVLTPDANAKSVPGN
jgi:hypothetical protein